MLSLQAEFVKKYFKPVFKATRIYRIKLLVYPSSLLATKSRINRSFAKYGLLDRCNPDTATGVIYTEQIQVSSGSVDCRYHFLVFTTSLMLETYVASDPRSL